LTGGGAGIGTFGDAMLWGVDAHLPTGSDPDPTPIVKTSSVEKVPGGVSLSGEATFLSTSLTSATDPEDDSAAPIGAGGDVLGAELSGGGVSYNADTDSLSIQWDLSDNVAAIAVGTPPSVLYAMEFRVAGTRYEVRVLKGAATSPAPKPDDVGGYMALFRCAPECTETTRLTGWFSWPNRSFVLVEVPLSAISAGEGSQLTGLRSFTAIGEASPGSVVPIDEVSLPSATIPESRVEFALAPASTPEDEVVFDRRATLSGGTFAGSIPTSGVSPGDYRIWSRACLGVVCGLARSIEVTI
jgi:hypothetical protein